jgi:hypothetical protein
MDILKRTDLERLAGVNEGPCVSIYLPTHPKGRESEQDAIRLKNNLRTAQRRLVGHWVRGPDAKPMLAEASSLPNDTTWWQQRDLGLAIFVGPGLFECYRLPIAFPEFASVAHRFRIRPLLPLLHNQHQKFFILELSQNQATLYSANHQSIERLDANLPHDLRSALNYDGADRGTQVHSASRAVGGKQAAVFHGQGGQPDAAKDDLLSYCRTVNKAVSGHLGNAIRPLLLACVDYLAPIYRKANTYEHLLDETLSGNQEYQQTKELHQRALQLVGHRLVNSQVSKAVNRYRENAGTARTCDDICRIVSAAHEGRIDLLLCDPEASVTGVHRPDVNEVEVTRQDDDEDLVNLAAAETLKHGGDVFAMGGPQLPTDSSVAAVFRF